MKRVNVALLGFGSLGQSFAKLLLEKKEEMEREYDTSVNVVAITTKTRGNLVDAWGIDLERVLKNIQETGVFPKTSETMLQRNSLDVAEAVEYDVLIEMTPLEFSTGQMATNHVKAALKRGKHVICANKGPMAWHYQELKSLAKKNNCRCLCETTVMDGTPVFSTVRKNLKLCKVQEIRGIINSTTNYILKELEEGKDLKTAVAEGKKLGIIETNPNNDLEGNEAAAKLAALVNGMMNADITPNDIKIEGIDKVTKEQLDAAAAKGKVIKMICDAKNEDGKITAMVGPVELDPDDVMANVNGTSMAISITTDLMGTITIMEEAPGMQQAGYGVFSDLMTLIKDM